ncbi:MAG: energy transducer TonB [Bacteroidota bacterium]
MNTTIGYIDLRSLYKRHILTGLIVAGSAHIMLIAGYTLYARWTDSVIEFPKEFKRVFIDVIPPPPSLEKRITLPVPMIGSSTPVSVGILVPIPDTEINPDATIATQDEMNQPIPGSDIGDPDGTIYVPDQTIITDEAPPPFVPVEKQPKAVSIVNPTYPKMAQRAGIEGTVHVNMWVTKEGTVRQAIIVKSSNAIFDEAAVKAALQWTFTPAIMNNGPVAVWVTVPFRFKLNTK